MQSEPMLLEAHGFSRPRLLSFKGFKTRSSLVGLSDWIACYVSCRTPAVQLGSYMFAYTWCYYIFVIGDPQMRLWAGNVGSLRSRYYMAF